MSQIVRSNDELRYAPSIQPKAPLAVTEHHGKPPLVILGGDYNALSVARSVSRLGVAVYAINEPTSVVRHSRCCSLIALPGRDSGAAWAEFLLSARSDHLKGSVLLAASDVAIELIARNREALTRRYVLDECNPKAQMCMLNKLSTYEAAEVAGVPTPAFWRVATLSDVETYRRDFVYPLIVKPQLSHIFSARFGKKFLRVNNIKELHRTLKQVSDSGVEFLLMEEIAGPDDLLCSYYTYLDENSDPLFHFTKRIIRRFPKNEGLACYHITDFNPEVQELALRLFRHVRLRGLANAEFKRDRRDGRLKLIECNARFTAANGLVSNAGFDLGCFVYRRLAGLPQKPFKKYRAGMRLWSPLEDFKAYRELRRLNELTFGQWLLSVCHWQTFPVFSWRDPMPTIVDELQRAGRIARRVLGIRNFASASSHEPNPKPLPIRRRPVPLRWAGDITPGQESGSAPVPAPEVRTISDEEARAVRRERRTHPASAAGEVDTSGKGAIPLDGGLEATR